MLYSLFKSMSAPLVCAALLGCAPGQAPEYLAHSAKPQAGAETIQSVERDVEAPEVFQITDRGLWEGRPSLGGVWVAHPNVSAPERVIIRNQATGAFVIGALFRRERNLPGPAFQVSSDAAAELGILAGQAQDINVTALRQQTTPTPKPTNAAPASTPLAPLGAGDSAAAQATPAPTAPKPQATSTLSRPFIQIGLFSIKANADRTAKRLNAKGIPTQAIPESLGGKKFWKVIAGPANSTTERKKLLTRIKAQGFSDAYAVKK